MFSNKIFSHPAITDTNRGPASVRNNESWLYNEN